MPLHCPGELHHEIIPGYITHA